MATIKLAKTITYRAEQEALKLAFDENGDCPFCGCAYWAHAKTYDRPYHLIPAEWVGAPSKRVKGVSEPLRLKINGVKGEYRKVYLADGKRVVQARCWDCAPKDARNSAPLCIKYPEYRKVFGETATRNLVKAAVA